MIGAEPACDEFVGVMSQPGLICKHLRARWESRDTKDRDVIGGCYFFESVADGAYLNSYLAQVRQQEAVVGGFAPSRGTTK